MQRMKKPPRHQPLIRCRTPSCPRFGTGSKHWEGQRFNLIETPRRSLADRSPRGGDERFEILTARRPQWRARVSQLTEDQVGVKVVRGVGQD